MNTYTIIRLWTILIGLALLAGCGDDNPSNPEPENEAPGEAVLTAPAADATEVELTEVELEWQEATDPNGDAVSYDVYLDGNNLPTTMVASGLNTTSYTLEDTLDHNTPYYWMITANDGNGEETESDVFSFTTREQTSEEKLEGLWIGVFGHGTLPADIGYAFLFRLDGTVRVFNLGNSADTTNAIYKAEGTYTISGSISNTVNTTYTYLEYEDETYSTEAYVNAAYDHMDGTWWDDDAPSTAGGAFYLDKEE